MCFLFLGSSFYKNTILLSNNNRIVFEYSNFINNFIIKTNVKLTQTVPTFGCNFLFTKYNQFTLVNNLNEGSKICFLINIKSFKILYSPSYGNYLIYLTKNEKLNKLLFKLPSGSLLYTDLFLLAFTGINTFRSIQKFKPAYRKYNLRSKKIKVRGVAMNPIDHHNGGRSNKKPLFLNKYNNIAKNNK